MATPTFHPDLSGAAVLVGPLEARILEYFWRAGGVRTVPEVHQALTGGGRELSYSAVKAVLNNLSVKGWLAKDQQGKRTCFHATLTREQFERDVMRMVIGSLKRNYGAPVIAQFVDQVAVDEDALQELERLIAQRRQDLGA